MKTKITFLLGLSLVTGLIFTSCEKDEETTPQEKVLYPVKITEYDDGVYDKETTFEYNADKKLVKVVYGSDFYETYAYDTEGKLIEYREYYDNSLDVLDSLEYNSNAQLIKIQRYNDAVKGGWYTVEYDAQGNVIKKSEYLTDETVYSYNIYEHDSQGNTINQKFYWKDHETGTILTDKYEETAFQYDDKNNIYKSWGLPFIWETYINNVLEETYTEHYGDGYTNTDTYTYVYNEDNYPVEYIEGDERYVIEYQEL